MALISRNEVHDLQGQSGTLKIDLTDPEVIEIIHIVAAAGFGTAYTSKGLLEENSGFTLLGNCTGNWCNRIVAYCEWICMLCGC